MLLCYDWVIIMSLDYKIIGERIKEHRSKSNLTQNQLSELLNVSNVYVSRIERGTTKVNLETLYRISTILDVSIGVLLTGIDQTASNYLDSEITSLLGQCSPKQKKLVSEIIKAVIKN